MTYTTRQRTLLLDFLRTRSHAHFSMQEILDFAREQGIGTATVYRYVDALVKEGSLRKFSTLSHRDGPCFQWHDTDRTQYHFICDGCGKCFHIECPQLEEMDEHIYKAHAFKLNLAGTVFQGHCADCSGKEAKL